MSIELIARRYATALADVVGNDYQKVQEELKVFAGMMTESRDLAMMFANPSLSHSDKSKVLETIIKKAKPTITTANFLRILLENGRLVNLADINQAFVTVLAERSGIVSAEVTSARELTTKEQKELAAGLEKMIGRKVNLKYGIDQTIIGGIVTRIGSTVYDSSVRTQLDNLKKQLVNG
jgi:F-type H+-transporting ATPase subunit delta